MKKLLEALSDEIDDVEVKAKEDAKSIKAWWNKNRTSLLYGVGGLVLGVVVGSFL